MCDENRKRRSEYAWEVEYDEDRGEVVTRATWDVLHHLDGMLRAMVPEPRPDDWEHPFWGSDGPRHTADEAVRDWIHAMIEIVP